MNWSDGYHTEAEYTHGYYKELSPTYQRFVALLNHHELTPTSDQDVHMELGFGQGISINIHAATHQGLFIGNDFNPSHAAHAQSLAKAAKTRVQLSDESFAQLDARTDLPTCASIGFHGIWSWINDENRQHIINIIQRCLKPNGLVYNSYNTFSGHAAFIPWRDMMWHYFEGLQGSAIDRIEATIAHFGQMFEKNPHLLEQSAALKSTWERVKTADRHYLLHEYFNANWDCFSVLQVAESLEAAKLQFIGTTNGNQYLNHMSLSPNALEQVQAQATPLLAESWRDVLVGNTFRRDLYAKGGRKLAQWEVFARLQTVRFIMVVEPSQFVSYLSSKQDGREFNADLFQPIRDALIQNEYQPKTFAQLYEAVDKSKYNWLHVLQVLLFKLESNQLQVCHEETDGKVKKQFKDQSKALNMALLAQLDYKVGNVYVACPETGMGLGLDFVHAWTLRVLLSQPKANDAEIAAQIWKCLHQNGRLLIDTNGQKLNDETSHMVYLKGILNQTRLNVPIWKQLGLL